MIQETPVEEHLLVQAESSPNTRSLAWIEDLMLDSSMFSILFNKPLKMFSEDVTLKKFLCLSMIIFSLSNLLKA